MPSQFRHYDWQNSLGNLSVLGTGGFHKIKDVDKSRTSKHIKAFMDMSVDYSDLKLIELEAVGIAWQVIECDNEMNKWVAGIYIPYIKDNEILSLSKDRNNKQQLLLLHHE